jgi:hypothetical protein
MHWHMHMAIDGKESRLFRRIFRKYFLLFCLCSFVIIIYGIICAQNSGRRDKVEMTSFASNDPAVITFIDSENSSRPVGSTDPFMPQQMQNGIANGTADNVIGVASISAGAPQIALGSGFSTIVVAGPHSTSTSSSGADSFSFNVDGSGTITLLDNNTGQSQIFAGAAYLVFKDAATNADATFQSIYFIGDANQSEVVRLYNAALSRQPDLGGVEYYANQLKTGFSFLQLAGEFMASPEFETRFGANATDSQFVAALYQNVLHRAPSASELAYYQAALSNYEAGHVVDSTNPVLWSRAQELLNFTNSPECQSDVSQLVINTAQGGYADTNELMSAQTVVTQGVNNGYINTALVGNVTSATDAIAAGSGGTVELQGNGHVGSTGTASGNQISCGADGITIVLSATVNIASMLGANDTVDSATSGGSIILLPISGVNGGGLNGGSVFLSGPTNQIVAGGVIPSVPSVAQIFGFSGGDYITQQNEGVTKVAAVLTGSAASPVQGSNLQFASTNTTLPHSYAVLVGEVADDSAVSMAAAANAAYKVGDVASENVIFIGQDPSGNAVLYHWARGDAHHTGLVDANAFTGAEVLIGVPTSAITVATFQ